MFTTNIGQKVATLKLAAGLQWEFHPHKACDFMTVEVLRGPHDMSDGHNYPSPCVCLCQWCLVQRRDTQLLIVLHSPRLSGPTSHLSRAKNSYNGSNTILLVRPKKICTHRSQHQFADLVVFDHLTSWLVDVIFVQTRLTKQLKTTTVGSHFL